MPPATEAELIDALARRHHGLPPSSPSQSFTVHDDVLPILIHEYSDPSHLYEKYRDDADSSGCIYFFFDQITWDNGWKVAAETQPVLDGSGAVVGRKDTLVFHEGRWLPKTRWPMDEFDADVQKGFDYSLFWLRLYRLRRLDE